MPSPTDSPNLTLPVSETRDHIIGPPDAPVTVVEYGDFECPHCAHAHQILQAAQDQIGDQFRLVFRHFPLSQIHPHAQPAAEAAEAATALDLFWDMHDLLFENQDALEDEDLARYAAQLNLDLPQFARDLSNEKFSPRVREDFSSGIKSGVNGTPTFFLNNSRLDTSWDLPDLVAAILAQAEHHTPAHRRAHRK